jgi:hypothetical protein
MCSCFSDRFPTNQLNPTLSWIKDSEGVIMKCPGGAVKRVTVMTPPGSSHPTREQSGYQSVDTSFRSS